MFFGVTIAQEYRACLQHAIDEGFIAWHQCHAYVLFKPKAAEGFA